MKENLFKKESEKGIRFDLYEEKEYFILPEKGVEIYIATWSTGV